MAAAIAFLPVAPAARIGTLRQTAAGRMNTTTTTTTTTITTTTTTTTTAATAALPARRHLAAGSRRRAARGPLMAAPPPTRAPTPPPVTPGTSSPPPPPGGDGDGGDDDARGRVDAKALVAQYGGAYIATSLALAATSFGLWYAAVANGVDVVALVGRLGDALAATPVGRPAALDRLDPGLSTAALAYVAHKASSPLRFPLTVALTPVVARVLKRGGGEDAKED